MTLVVNVTCSGSDGEKRIELGEGEKLDIGRSNDKASLTVDARLSRKHFTIRYVDGKIEITHHSKTNPTMVAPLGSKDFKKVKGVQIESDGCRIMAGSHRFVLTMTKADSEPRMGFSDDVDDEGSAENRSDFWSDVDSEQAEQTKKKVVRSETEFDATFSATSDVRSQMTEERSPTRKKPVSEKVARNMPTQKNVFFDDDPEDKKTEPPVKKPDPKPKKPPTKKPIFPIGDDFFDD